MLIRLILFASILILPSEAFAQKTISHSVEIAKKIEQRNRKEIVKDSIQLEFDHIVAEFEATKAKLDSLSDHLNSFDILYTSENIHKRMSLLSQNKSKIADYLVVKDFWMMLFYPDTDDEDFLYLALLKNEVSFFDKEINHKMNTFIFNRDLISSLAFSYKELYGKEIAILFVEKKLKEAYSSENKKQNLTLLLAKLKQ